MTVWNFAPRLSIKYKLLAGFLLVLILVAAFGVYAVGTLNTVDKSFNEVERQQEDLAKLAQLQISHTALADSVKALIITGDQKWERLYDDASIDFDKTVAELKALEEDPEEIEVFADFEAINNRVKGTELLILAKARAGDVARATELFDANYEGFQKEASRILAGLLGKETQEIGEDIQEGKSLLVSIKKVLVILLAGLIVAVVVISLFLAALLTRPLKKLVRAAQTISQGDLTARVENSSRDEIGRLAAAFNEMADRLQESRAGLEQQVAERTQELSKTNRELEWDITERKQAEQALRESEERYRRLYQNTPVMMHSIDLDGRLVSVNDHWLKVLGYERSEVIGRKSIEFLTDASRHYATNVALPEFFEAGGVAKEVEYQFVKKNGEVRDTLLSAVGERNESGEICRLSGFIIDVTERKQAEQALRESEERYRRLVELSPDAIVVVSEGKIVFANPAEATLMAASRAEELIGTSAIDLLHPEDSTTVEERLRRIAEEGEAPHLNEGKIVRLDGQVRDIEAAGAPIIYEGKKAVQIICRDITDRKRAEEAERRWTEETSVMAEIGRTVNASLDINEVYDRLGEEIKRLIPFDRMSLSLVDQGGGVLVPTWDTGVGLPGRREGENVPLSGTLSEHVLRTRASIIVDGDSEQDVRHRFPRLMASFRSGFRSHMAIPLFNRNQTIAVLRFASREHDAYSQPHSDLAERVANQIAGAIANYQLYAQQKDAEERIKASLDEKEVLLKEINHRVKNNLQIISSLLNLQSRDIQDEEALRSFQVSQDRIKAMALVHEKLYQSDDLARIDFGEYIKSLATDLGNSYGLSSRNIDLKIDVEDILLGVDTAIPCGVIVNELVANSLKHAFPEGRSGEITVSFQLVDGQYTMIFKDDGVGLPEDLDISRPASLGLTIVNALTGQLGGTIGLGRKGGSEIRITFPANKP